MKVKVDVPATASRKAYSYFRNANAVKKGAAGVGAALALGGLAAAAIALRKTPEESKAIPAPVPAPTPTQPTSSVGSVAKKVAISGAGIAATGLAAKTIAKKAVQDRKKKKETEEEMEREAGRKKLEKSLSELSAEIDKTFSRGEAPPSSASAFTELISKGEDLALDLSKMAGEPKTQPSVKPVQSASGRQMSKQVSQQVSKNLLPNEKSALKIRQLGNTIYGSLGEGPDRLPYQKPKPEVGGAMVLVGKAAEAPKAAEKPKPTRFREQDEFAEGDEPETPILINGKSNPKYYEAAKRGHIEPEEASRLARNISAERAGIALSKEDRSLSGFYSNDKIRAAGSRNLEKQIAKGEYLPPPDRLPSPNGVLPSTKPKFEIPRTLIPPVRSQSSLSSALTVTPSESPKNTGDAIAEPKKSRLTQIAGSAGAALGRIYRKGVNTYNASIERDRVAREKLASRTVDLNEVSRKVGSGARSVLNAVDGLAQRVKKSIAKEPPAIDVKAEEIKEPEPPRKMRGITIRALPQGGKRRRGRPKLKFTPKDFVNPEDKQVRNNSVYMRIDSFVEQLREDAKCGSGTKPCGKICIPQDKNCIGETAKAFGGGALQSLAGPIGSGTYRALRSQGRGRGTSIAGAIGANIAATAGTIALGNMAYNKALKDQEEALRNPVKKGAEMGRTITKMADKDFEKAKKKGK